MTKFERGKDSAQEVVESASIHVGRIATIITTAVADVTREIGDIVTDAIEMRQASKRAAEDEANGGTADGSAAGAHRRAASDGPASDGPASPSD